MQRSLIPNHQAPYFSVMSLTSADIVIILKRGIYNVYKRYEENLGVSFLHHIMDVCTIIQRTYESVNLSHQKFHFLSIILKIFSSKIQFSFNYFEIFSHQRFDFLSTILNFFPHKIFFHLF